MKLNANVIAKLALGIAILFVLYKVLDCGKKSEFYDAYDPRSFEGAPVKQTAATKKKKYAVGKNLVTTAPLTVSKDLLPKPADTDNDWSMFAPKPDALRSQQFLDSKTFLYGENTIGSSLKNANHSLRRDPTIKRDLTVSPWGISTIESSDVWRKALDCE